MVALDFALQFIAQNTVPVLMAIMGLLLLGILIFLVVVIRLGRIMGQYRSLMRGMNGKNLEEMLGENLRMVKLALERVDGVELTCQKLEAIGERSVQNVGVVRYNAFENVGSDLSFSVALLDKQGNGVVITSLYGREYSRTYAKPVEKNQSSYPLTDEEKEAIRKAYGGENRAR